MPCMAREPWPPNMTRPVGRSGSRVELAQLRAAIDLDLRVEIRADDHPGGQVHALRAVAERARLRGRLGRAADEVLSLPRLDPEVRRIVREIGEQGDVGHVRGERGDRLVHRAVEVRDERNHHVGPGLAPVAPQPARHGSMAHANGRLQELELLREADAPAARETVVVDVLPVHARGLAEHILGIEHLHEIDEAYLPGALFRADHGLQGRRGRAMPSPRIEIDQIDCSCHGPRAMHWLSSSPASVDEGHRAMVHILCEWGMKASPPRRTLAAFLRK